MDAEATVVWIAPARDAQDRHALDEWALARGIRLVTPRDGKAPDVPVDPSVADRVEDELDRARDAVAAQEPDAAERALARAEALLYEHPELPHAAWLMAEVHRGWSARWHRLEPRDQARGAAAWLRAAALDGGRVAGIGETEAPPTGGTVTATLELEGAAPGTTLRLDGAELAPGPVTRPAGEHQVTVSDGTVVRAAAWVALADGARIRIRVPAAPPCSSEDLARARRTDDAIAAGGVRCGAWIAVLPAQGPSGMLRIASCDKGACGPLVEWRALAPPVGPSGPPPTEELPKRGRWPAWATLTIFGAGIVAATTVALAAAGAFDKQRTDARFVNGGIKVQGF
jgi:hypothetical protein